MGLAERLATVLGAALTVRREDDGALTVHHDDTVASLRVVTIAEDLPMVSLTQVLAWDLPSNAELRGAVAEHAHNTLLGTVSSSTSGPAAEQADVLLRYNFPAAGLTDEALLTLVLLVLAGGADVRRALVG